MRLHLINFSPSSQQSLRRCAELTQPEDSFLFYEDAVLFCLQIEPNAQLFRSAFADRKCMVIKADLEARGIQEKACLSCVRCIDYDEWVSLTEQASGIQTWN